MKAARAARAKVLEEEDRSCTIAIVIREGRKREVRRMLEAVGHPVRSLCRVRFGPIRLETLARGKWRDLSPQELSALRDEVES